MNEKSLTWKIVSYKKKDVVLPIFGISREFKISTLVN